MHTLAWTPAAVPAAPWPAHTRLGCSGAMGGLASLGAASAGPAPGYEWLARTDGGEWIVLMLAAAAATFGYNAIADTSDEAKGYVLIGAGLGYGLLTLMLREACGSARTSFCLIAG